MIDPGPAAISSVFPPVPSLTNLRCRSGAAGVVGAGCSCFASIAPHTAAAQSTPSANVKGACRLIRRSLRGNREGSSVVTPMTRTGSRDGDARVPDDRLKIAGRFARVTIRDQATLFRPLPYGGLQLGAGGGDPAHADVLPKDDTMEPVGIDGQHSLDRLMVLLLGDGRGHVMGHVAADDQQDLLSVARDRVGDRVSQLQEVRQVKGPDTDRHETNEARKVL